MYPLFLSASLRTIEQTHSSSSLMQRAGNGLVRWVSDHYTADQAILILAGPGNNGGDAWVVANHLFDQGYHVCVLSFDLTSPMDHVGAFARQSYISKQGTVAVGLPPVLDWDLIIDGLFGIGLHRLLDPKYIELIRDINCIALEYQTPVLSIDIPSGLYSDDGTCGAAVIRADTTYTLIGLKPGLYTNDGPSVVGEIILDDLHLESPVSGDGYVLDSDMMTKYIRPRSKNSHKGSHGSVGMIGGASSMVGAIFLASRTALKAGAGRVYVGCLDPQAPTFDMITPELMVSMLDKLLKMPLDAIACGPGLGQSDEALDVLKQVLTYPCPKIIDADGLNLIARHPELHSYLHARMGMTVLTPHPTEAARLLGCSTADIQAHRIRSACDLARQLSSVVVLKGCGSVIADPAGRWWINSTGNPGLATAGTGDVLTGLIASLLAQGYSTLVATQLGVYLHGLAADYLVDQGIGPTGLCASELIDAIRHCLNNGFDHSCPILLPSLARSAG